MNLPRLLAGLALVPVAGWLAVSLHELGHWAGGLLVRFRTLLVVVWPFRVRRDGDRLRVGTVWNLSFIGGMVACLPTDTRRLRQRMAVLAAGGPAASLVAGVGLLWAWAAWWRPRDPEGIVWAGTFLAFLVGAFSLMVALSSLWPREAAGYRSDGARLLALRAGSEEVEQEFALVAVSALSLAGTRPRDWDPALLARATEGKADPILALAAGHLRWAWHLDRGEVTEARAAMQAVLADLERLPAEVAGTILLDAAWFAAWHDGDAAAARAHLAQATSTVLASPHEQPLAEAAIALREGAWARAGALLDEAERLLPRALDRGQALVAAERITTMRAGARPDTEAT